MTDRMKLFVEIADYFGWPHDPQYWEAFANTYIDRRLWELDKQKCWDLMHTAIIGDYDAS